MTFAIVIGAVLSLMALGMLVYLAARPAPRPRARIAAWLTQLLVGVMFLAINLIPGERVRTVALLALLVGVIATIAAEWRYSRSATTSAGG